MYPLHALIIVFFCLLFSKHSSGQTTVDSAKANQLSASETWLKLLKYEKNTFSGKLESSITTKQFFLSSHGNTDPLLELNETINAFQQPILINNDSHAQCKFRGRYVWLKSQLKLESQTWPIVHCPQYEKWSLNKTTESLSVIFATGYLGNPASYYGHTLIKLNSHIKNKTTSLEDISVNFGAIIPPKEAPLPYIVKGLFGGYDAGFSHIQFYFHNHNYSETELRDLWEYELNLNTEEVDLILGHIWELFEQKYTYYFLNKNCVYRMAEVLEIIPGIDIIPDNSAWTIPQALIQKMAQAKSKNGEPLVKKVTYIPSRQSRFYQQYKALKPSERAALSNELSFGLNFETETYNQLSIKSKQAISDTLIDYYQFLATREKLEKWEALKRKAILQRFQLPEGSNTFKINEPSAPHTGRPPSMLSIGRTFNNQLPNNYSLHFRPAYYDNLDSYDGNFHSSLSMMELSLLLKDGQTKIDNLHLIKIEKNPQYFTGIAEDKGKSWLLDTGWERTNLSCMKDCTIAYAKAEIGESLHKSFGYRVGAGAQENSLYTQPIYANIRLFSFFDFTPKLKAKFDIEQRISPNAKKQYRPTILSLETHWQLSKNNAIRLMVKKHNGVETNLSLRHYF